MQKRLPFVALVVAALAGWWMSDHWLVPWVQTVTGYRGIQDRASSVLLGHWLIDQLPRVLVCLAMWIVGTRLGLMPSFAATLGSGGSWRRVAISGLVATAAFLVITIVIGLAADGTFGFHPDPVKMAGDLVSNLYEEVVYRGLMFCAFYGLAAAAAFPLRGALDRWGVALGTLGSCLVFAIGHEQYPLELRVVIGLVAVVFVVPWVKARSLWAPWIPHTLGDFVADTILRL